MFKKTWCGTAFKILDPIPVSGIACWWRCHDHRWNDYGGWKAGQGSVMGRWWEGAMSVCAWGRFGFERRPPWCGSHDCPQRSIASLACPLYRCNFRERPQGMNQVWSLTQFYSVDFSQSRIGVKKCVFNKRKIKVCVSCSWRCPWTFAFCAAHLTVSLYLCSSGSNVCVDVEGPWMALFQLKKPLNELNWSFNN